MNETARTDMVAMTGVSCHACSEQEELQGNPMNWFAPSIISADAFPTPNRAVKTEDPLADVITAARSVCGPRDVNEDRALTGHIILPSSSSLSFAAVADGMGGYEGGETAACIACEYAVAVISEYLAACAVEHTPFDGGDCLAAAVTEANRAVQAFSAGHPDFANMGCTLTVGLIVGNILHV